MKKRDFQCPYCGSWLSESQTIKLELHALMECRPDYLAVGIRKFEKGSMTEKVRVF